MSASVYFFKKLVNFIPEFKKVCFAELSLSEFVHMKCRLWVLCALGTVCEFPQPRLGVLGSNVLAVF